MIVENFAINFNQFNKYSDIKKGIFFYLANDIDRRTIITTYKHQRKPIPNIIKGKNPSNELINLINNTSREELLNIVPTKYKTLKSFNKEFAQLKKRRQTINLKMANILGYNLCYTSFTKCIPKIYDSVGTDIIQPSSNIPEPINIPSKTKPVFIVVEPESFTNNLSNNFSNKIIIIIIILLILILCLFC